MVSISGVGDGSTPTKIVFIDGDDVLLDAGMIGEGSDPNETGDHVSGNSTTGGSSTGDDVAGCEISSTGDSSESFCTGALVGSTANDSSAVDKVEMAFVTGPVGAKVGSGTTAESTASVDGKGLGM